MYNSLLIDTTSGCGLVSAPMNYIAERRLEEKERRRAEIVDAAEAAGREVGLDALTMDDVARRARLSRALLYVYFQDRSDLMFGLAERAMTMLHARFVEAAERHRTGLDQVSAMGRAYVAFSQEFPVLFDALARCELQSSEPTQGSPSEQACALGGDRLQARLVASLETGVRDGSIRATGFAHADERHAVGLHARNHPAHHHQGSRADASRGDARKRSSITPSA